MLRIQWLRRYRLCRSHQGDQEHPIRLNTQGQASLSPTEVWKYTGPVVQLFLLDFYYSDIYPGSLSGATVFAQEGQFPVLVFWAESQPLSKFCLTCQLKMDKRHSGQGHPGWPLLPGLNSNRIGNVEKFQAQGTVEYRFQDETDRRGSSGNIHDDSKLCND